MSLLKNFGHTLLGAFLLLLGSGCITTQDLVTSRAMYDHPCGSSHLFVGPTQAREGEIKGFGEEFSVVCSEQGNNWKAIYHCESKLFSATTCKEVK